MIASEIWATDTKRVVELTSILSALDDTWTAQSQKYDDLRREIDLLHAVGRSAAPQLEQLAVIAAGGAALEDTTVEIMERLVARLNVIASRG